MSYQEDIFLDSDELDKEWIKQSSLYLKYSSLHADAIAERDKCKEELEVVKAEILVDLQSNFDNYGFDKKPTDSVAKSYIETEKEVIAFNKKLIELNKDVNILQAARAALDHKKKALENLTTLWVQNWHAEPKEGVFNKGYESELFQRKQTRELKSNKRLQNLKKKKEDKNG